MAVEEVGYKLIFDYSDFNKGSEAVLNGIQAIADSQDEVNQKISQGAKASSTAMAAQVKATEKVVSESKEMAGVQKDLTDRTKDLTNQTNKLTAARIKDLRTFAQSKSELKQRIKDYRILGTSIGETQGLFKALSAVGKNWIKVLGLTRVAIIGTGIGALLIALTSMVSFLKNTERGTNILNTAMAGLGAVVELLMDSFNALGEALFDAFANPKQSIQDLADFIKNTLYDKTIGRLESLGKVASLLFSGEFKAAAKEATDVITGVNNSVDKATGLFEGAGQSARVFAVGVAQAAAAGASIERQFIALRKEQIKLNVANSEYRSEIELLKKDSEDTTRLINERLAASQKAYNLENELLQKQIGLKQEELNLTQREIQFQSDDDKIENLERVAALQIELNELTEQSTTKQIELQNKNNELQREANAQIQAQQDALSTLNEEYNSLFDGIEAPFAVLQDQLQQVNDYFDDYTDKVVTAAENTGKTSEEVEELKRQIQELRKNSLEPIEQKIRIQNDTSSRESVEGIATIGIELPSNTDDNFAEAGRKAAEKMANGFDEVAGISFEDSLKRLGDEVAGFFGSELFQDSFGALNGIADGISAIMSTQIDALDQLADQRQEQINDLESDLEREQELYDLGLANNVGSKKEELETLISEQEAYNERANELRKNQIKIETAQAVAQTAVQGVLAVSKAFVAHANIPFVGVAIAAGFAATILAQIKAAKNSLNSLYTGADRVGDHFGTIDRGGASDMPGRGSEGYGVYRMSKGKAVSDTGVRMGGNERLVTERTNALMGHIIDDIERNPSHVTDLENALFGDPEPLISAGGRVSQYIINNNSKGITDAQMEKVMRKVLSEQTNQQISYDKDKEETIVIPPGSTIIKKKGKKVRRSTT